MFGKKHITLEEITPSEVAQLRRCFEIPDRITDQEIISTLVNDIISRHFSVESWTQDDVKQLLDF